MLLWDLVYVWTVVRMWKAEQFLFQNHLNMKGLTNMKELRVILLVVK